MTDRYYAGEDGDEFAGEVEEKGDYVLILADNTRARVTCEGGTVHNGVPVLRSYYDPQD